VKLKDRLVEPSTWAGLGVIASMVPGLAAAPTNVMGWLTAIAGLVAIFKPEAVQPPAQ
jgi:hypothetical protein